MPSTFTFLPLTEVVVEGGVAPIDDPGSEGGGEGGAEGDGEPAHEDLVHLLPGGEPLVWLTLPLLGAVSLVDIVGELLNMSAKCFKTTRGAHMQIAANAKEEEIRHECSDGKIHGPESGKSGMHLVLKAFFHNYTINVSPTFH